MRLIDADALIAKQASIAKTFARSDAQKSLMGRVMYNTEKAPAVDAIPVEWLRGLKEKLYGNSNGLAYRMLLDVIMSMWQKEQEAKDDTCRY